MKLLRPEPITAPFVHTSLPFLLVAETEVKLIAQMLSRYVTTSGDKSILRRALPLAEVRYARFQISIQILYRLIFNAERAQVVG